MSSDETPEKGKQKDITRSKQSRRKMLKSMAAGSGAVIAGKSIPEQWAKPMVDSVLLPAHAQTSLTCSAGGTVEVFTNGDTSQGVFPIPGSYNSPNGSPMIVNPDISVTPGITDAFNLTTGPTAGDYVTDPTTANQNLTPDPANGAIAFASIVINDFSTPYTLTMTLTPDNQSLCGGPQVINVTFDNPP